MFTRFYCWCLGGLLLTAGCAPEAPPPAPLTTEQIQMGGVLRFMAAKIVSAETQGPIVSPSTIDRTCKTVTSLVGHPRLALQRDEQVALMWWVMTTCYAPTVPLADVQAQCARVSNQPIGGSAPAQREHALLAYLGMCLPEVYTALQDQLTQQQATMERAERTRAFWMGLLSSGFIRMGPDAARASPSPPTPPLPYQRMQHCRIQPSFGGGATMWCE